MVFLLSSVRGEKGFQLVLNGTERDRLVVLFYFRESLRTALRLHSREQNQRFHPGQVPHKNACPAGGHRHHCSQHCQPWCRTMDPAARPVVSAAPDTWTTHCHLRHVCQSTQPSSASVSPCPESESSMWSPAWWSLGLFQPAGMFGNKVFCLMEEGGLCLLPRL